MTTHSMPTPLMQARDIVKIYGTLRANDHVGISLMPGEIHALLGENGAGKSTLVKILYGLVRPTSGHLSWQGREVALASPAMARDLGIGMVFQHFSLFENMSVAENVALGLPGGRSLAAIAASLAAVSRDYGLPLDPDRPVHSLSVGERQRIEIVRCLMQEPSLIILDEPTSVLTPQEAEQLFGTLRRLAGEGKAVLFISHRLEDVRALCTTATVLRHGKVVGTCDPRAESAASLARLMVGADVAGASRPAETSEPGPVRLALSGVSMAPEEIHGTPLRDISLEVRGGEVVAIAGVAGNGQSELFDVLSGERGAATPDAVRIDGTPVGRTGINGRRRLGAAFVPEERLGHGAVPAMPLSANALLTRHATDDLVSHGLVSHGATTALSRRICADYDVRKGSDDPEAGRLSGGNLQKFVVGREIDRKPGILIVNQPTWGVDAGASALIRRLLIDLARQGAAVLVISQDLDEIFEIADRIAVMHDGRLSQPEPNAAMTAERIGLLMGGVGDAH